MEEGSVLGAEASLGVIHSPCTSFDAPTVSVQYNDQQIDVALSDTCAARRSPHMSLPTLAFSLQAALNLGQPPVALNLNVAQGEDAVVCPLSVLVACPTFVTNTFKGRSWGLIFQHGGEGWDGPQTPIEPQAVVSTSPSVENSSKCKVHQKQVRGGNFGWGFEREHPYLDRRESLLDVAVPNVDEVPLVGGEPTASPSEGRGRPLTAPPRDRTLGVARPRPGRREGQGRPMSATPSDKSFGMRRFRPSKTEGCGRPMTALPSDHGSSPSPARSCSIIGNIGFQHDRPVRSNDRPSTAPVPGIFSPLDIASSWSNCAGNDTDNSVDPDYHLNFKPPPPRVVW